MGTTKEPLDFSRGSFQSDLEVEVKVLGDINYFYLLFRRGSSSWDTMGAQGDPEVISFWSKNLTTQSWHVPFHLRPLAR